MLQSGLFARVYLTCNGSIYIAFASGKIIICSSRSLSCLISRPFELRKGEMGEFKDISQTANPKRLPLAKIPGLTLITIGNDNSIHCDYPIILQAMFSSSLPSTQNEPLRLHLSTAQSAIEDEKCFFLQIFCGLIDTFKGRPQFKNHAPTTNEFRQHFFEETMRAFGLAAEDLPETPLCATTEIYISPALDNSSTETTIPYVLTPEETPERELTSDTSSEIPPNYVSIQDFAELRDVSKPTVHDWLRKGKIPCEKYIKIPSGHVYIDADVPKPVDGRSTRFKNNPEKEPRRPKYAKSRASYEDTQRRIQDDNIVSDAVRQYISAFEEAQYYQQHHYHEVVLNGKPALIIDINPEYYCERLGKTNRELIQAGKSPVVPSHDDQHYHLHHIGQQKESPLAIIPEADHNSKKLYSALHRNTNCVSDIHGKDFEEEKKAFWLAYLDLYDTYKDFKKIPYNNKRNRTARKDREWR